MPSNDGGLGDHLIGDKINVGERNLQVVSLLGEGKDYCHVEEESFYGVSANSIMESTKSLCVCCV